MLRRLVVKSCSNVKFLVGTVDGFVRQDGDDLKISGVTVRDHGLEAADFVIGAFPQKTKLRFERHLKDSIYKRRDRFGSVVLPQVA